MTNSSATTSMPVDDRRGPAPGSDRWPYLVARVGVVPAVAGLLIVLGTVVLRYPADGDAVAGYLVTLAVGVVLLWMGIASLQRPAKALAELEEEVVQQLARLESGPAGGGPATGAR